MSETWSVMSGIRHFMSELGPSSRLKEFFFFPYGKILSSRVPR